MPAMKKRILAAFLWFYAGWYGGALLANFTGVNPVLGPILGAAVAALVVGDPRRIIWKAREHAPSVSAATVGSAIGPEDDTAIHSV